MDILKYRETMKEFYIEYMYTYYPASTFITCVL